MKAVVEMEWKKNTKGTVVYQSKFPDGAIQVLYIKKDKLPHPSPTEIEVSVNWISEEK